MADRGLLRRLFPNPHRRRPDIAVHVDVRALGANVVTGEADRVDVRAN